jgi:preprotein translocase subunit SecD
MLHFSRWKAAVVLATALVVCLCAVPNFFSEQTLRSWPKWAQRHIVLGLDLQGGSHLLYELDSNTLRQEKLQQLADDVLHVLREAKIGFTGRALRDDHIEVLITHENDVPQALVKLRELSQPLGGLLSASGERSVEITHAGRGLIQLRPSQAAVTERIREAIEESIRIVEHRINELGTVEPSIQRQGLDRILVQVPGPQDTDQVKRVIELVGRTARLTFRLIDVTGSLDDALQGRPPPDSEVLYGPAK